MKNIKIAPKFDDNGCRSVTRDGTEIGWIERVYGEDFVSASSYARKKTVLEYLVVLSAPEFANLDDVPFDTLKKAQDFCRAFEIETTDLTK